MSDLFWNKIIGALLATALGIFGIRALGHALVHSQEPAVPGYHVATAEENAKPAPKAEAAPVLSLAQLLGKARADSGARVAKKCAACHDLTQGGPNKIGPNLWGVVGRGAGSHPGFKYSQAMQDFGDPWSYENLDKFLTSPKALVPGTAMGFAGLKKPKDRASLLAYLRTLSDSPLPLPVVAAAATDADTASANPPDEPPAALADVANAVGGAAGGVRDGVQTLAGTANKAEEKNPDQP